MELEFIRWLREHVPADPRAKLGLRDDAALLSLAGNSEIVVTADLLTDGVDFRVGHDDLPRIGRQALGANLSDLAAMAAKPLAAFISVALPHDGPAGQGPLADESKGAREDRVQGSVSHWGAGRSETVRRPSWHGFVCAL